MKLLLSIFFLFVSFVSLGGSSKDSVRVYDLKSDWEIFTDRTYEPYDASNHSNVKVIYLEIDPGRYQKGSVIRIQSSKDFSIYLNSKFFTLGSKSVKINMDSLRDYIPVPWRFGIHQFDGLSWLRTEIISTRRIQSDQVNVIRPSNYYLDFSILASIILIVFFILLLHTNTRLTFDYFNFIRLFSIQEREDSLLNSRISSSANVLYYGFSSISIGFVLLTIFHFGAEYISIAESFIIYSFGSAFLQWGKLSLVIAAILIVRLIVLSIFSGLFNFRDALSLQFYNSIRLGFFISIVSSFVCLGYFIFKIQTPGLYSSLLGGIIVILVSWILIMGLKLLRRTPFRFFHLFSYLCASELIPVVILVKVLNS